MMTTRIPRSLRMICCLAGAFLFNSSVVAKTPVVRTIQNFDFDWKFHQGDLKDAQQIEFDDRAWKSVTLPHDWSIAGPFAKDNAGGKSGGYVPLGIGWYRKSFILPSQHQGKKVFIRFDGIYKNSEVWINGASLGKRWYGYVSFQYDLTEHLRWDQPNILAVRVDNSRQTCRWYSGSGIYRHVRLIVTDKLRITQWGVCVTTPKITSAAAAVNIVTTLRNQHDETAACTLKTRILDTQGVQVASEQTSSNISKRGRTTLFHKLSIPSPQLWSVESPQLYYAHSQVYKNDILVDDLVTPFGIRQVKWHRDKGLFVNNNPVVLKGVCLHHDLGALGSAFHERALERRLEILKELGCNAIRTSHNPPAPQLLDLCDRMGFLVIDEAFDKWGGGHYKTFEKDWPRDLYSMIYRDRNHPCIILWSVGNEVGQQGKPKGVKIIKQLVDFVRRHDRTRLITYGAFPRFHPDFVKLVDIAGLNYQEQWYEKYRQENPRQLLMSTESYAYFRGKGDTHKAFHPVNPWLDVPKHDYVVGAFYWTGIDYLGEAVAGWPYHGWNCSLIDTCGFPRPVSYLIKSFWSDEPMVHIAVFDDSLDVPAPTKDHWGWPKMASHWNMPLPEGEKVKVVTFTNCPTVELILNGKSYGTKNLADFPDKMITWKIPYQPGTIEARGVKQGTTVCEHQLQTAGKPKQIILIPDRMDIKADQRDLCHVEVKITDEKGVLVPGAHHKLDFQLQGPGKILAVDNGDLTSTESYQAKQRKAFYGRCLIIIQAADTPGPIQLTANAPDLAPGKLTIDSRK